MIKRRKLRQNALFKAQTKGIKVVQVCKAGKVAANVDVVLAAVSSELCWFVFFNTKRSMKNSFEV